MCNPFRVVGRWLTNLGWRGCATDPRLRSVTPSAYLRPSPFFLPFLCKSLRLCVFALSVILALAGLSLAQESAEPPVTASDREH
jgi:hypothetical protein